MRRSLCRYGTHRNWEDGTARNYFRGCGTHPICNHRCGRWLGTEWSSRLCETYPIRLLLHQQPRGDRSASSGGVIHATGVSHHENHHDTRNPSSPHYPGGAGNHPSGAGNHDAMIHPSQHRNGNDGSAPSVVQYSATGEVRGGQLCERCWPSIPVT
jgi:hypothetical protein